MESALARIDLCSLAPPVQGVSGLREDGNAFLMRVQPRRPPPRLWVRAVRMRRVARRPPSSTLIRIDSS
jgi:hypothetical protein